LCKKKELTYNPALSQSSTAMLVSIDHLLVQGETALCQGDRSAYTYFKQAAHLAPERPEPWAGWASALLQLGKIQKEHHFFLEAKEKFQYALARVQALSVQKQTHLYWEYGRLWMELASFSGEALDIRLALQAFSSAMNLLTLPSAQFLHDYGNGYLQMGLLTNDPRLYHQAIHLLRQALALDNGHLDALRALAEAYAQLYINTVDEQIAEKGCECYHELTQKIPHSLDAWLGWAQLLGETARINRDIKKFQAAIDKCVIGHRIDPNHHLLQAQWVESLSYLGVLTNRLDLLIEAERKIIDMTDRFPDDPDLWHAYGVCLIGFGHYYSDPDYYDFAIEKLQEGLSIDRTHAELWHALGLAHTHFAHLVGDQELIERATRFYAFAIDLKPACPSLLFDAANAWLVSSDLHDDEQDLHRAIELYEQLLQSQKEILLNHPEWLFQYATALEWLSDFTVDDRYCIQAIDLYLHILLIDPETDQIHFRLATCFARLGESSAQPEYDQRAQQHFCFAVRQDEEDANVWLEWGLSCFSLAMHSVDPHMKQQALVDAEQKMTRAGLLGNRQVYYHLACLYSATERCAEAMDLLHKAQRYALLPPVEELIENEWLDNLRHTEMFVQFLSSLERKG
jgi:tetratricopeptide (TPR) repeat protein